MELPLNESDRLAALYRYGVLDTGFEERFDRLTRLAAAVFGTPICLISLVDTNRQWFKSALGLKVRETSRDISFCTHAILGQDVFVVPDARQDERFKRNPLVTGDPNVRFYAGAPLVARDGHALGTFCIIDRDSRQDFPGDQQQILKDFAGCVVDFFELQSALRESRAKRRNLAGEIEQVAGELGHFAQDALPEKTRSRLSDITARLAALAGESVGRTAH